MTERKHDGSNPATLDDVEELFALHEQREQKMFDRLMAAFPDGPEKHAEYHQKLINAAKAEEEFWQTAKVEIIKRGVGGLLWVLSVVFGLILLGLSAKFGFAIPLIGPKP
jgi:hypothetical protein